MKIGKRWAPWRQAALLATLALAGCGGGASDTELQATRFPTDQQAALEGDWPDPVPPALGYVARNAGAWQALWASRRAGLDCSRAYNASACGAAEPPAVDFSKYAVVGIRYACFYASLDVARVHLAGASGRLVVDFTYYCVYKAPPQPAPMESLFVLVPQAPGPIELTLTERS